MTLCECCEREQKAGSDAAAEAGWVVDRNGDAFCPECAGVLKAQAQRMVDALPKRIALCPQCAAEFYYPLADGEDDLSCPTPGCAFDMVTYAR